MIQKLSIFKQKSLASYNYLLDSVMQNCEQVNYAMLVLEKNKYCDTLTPNKFLQSLHNHHFTLHLLSLFL